MLEDPPTRERRELIEQLQATVHPEEGEIPAFIFSHPLVYELEQERLFGQVWLFLAHESEIPEPTDFVVRDLAGQSVVVMRGRDGVVRAFLNMCRHRGMPLCRTDQGRQARFVCPYHGFTYNDRGELVGVPFHKEVFGSALDQSQLGLIAPRIESYAGLIFGTWNEAAPPLAEFLGDMRWYLDLVVNRAEMAVVGPPQRWYVDASWMLAADNFIHDSYHTMYTHASIAKLGMVPSADYSKYGYQIECGHGHGLNLGIPSPEFVFCEELREEYAARLSPEQYQVLSQLKNMVGTVFPNLSFLVSATHFKGQPVSNTTLRLWVPRGPGRMEIWAWMLVEKRASEEWKRRSRQVSVLTFSPTGIFEQDDTENFLHITAATRGWLAWRRKLAFVYRAGLELSPVTDFVGPGRVYPTKYCEATARAFYRQWLDYMTREG